MPPLEAKKCVFRLVVPSCSTVTRLEKQAKRTNKIVICRCEKAYFNPVREEFVYVELPQEARAMNHSFVGSTHVDPTKL